eukprot:CAMPEP_0202082100 /NCGR_PEP_ID=MMETSP0964-20121228/17764_1 /ASSEMBLY_ACC=CAM_ASM_000500 /TAXON_ID=4773 /ORGANISM="Schizochytrium aggregatum, Strain ATCC28209" /LENGTH=516 /DNA_ID=CAMNT_0048649719 /DNA_START=9 /DNA_END=1559 /DNA_ORIENTATION=+
MASQSTDREADVALLPRSDSPPPDVGEPVAPTQRSRNRAAAGAAILLLVAAAVAIVATVSSSGNSSPDGKDDDHNVDAGEPLLLSELLAKDPAAARDAARIKDDSVYPGTNAYAAYFTVDEERQNHMYWTFLEPQNKPADGTNFPILVWLQGGPGASSAFGLFVEVGPVFVQANMTTARRETHWNDDFGLLFIDNPVGAGFSFTETGMFSNSSKYDVADQLYSVLDQFYQLFPAYQRETSLYLSGESYAGHYSVGLAHKLLREADRGSRIPFQGLALGNAWIDPITMIAATPQVLYHLSVVSDHELAIVQSYCDRAVAHIKRGEYDAAFQVWDRFFNNDLSDAPNALLNLTGISDIYNILNTAEPADENNFESYLQQPRVRRAIHAGNRTFSVTNRDVEIALRRDFMTSFRTQIEDLLEADYRIMFYNGALDIIVNPVLTRTWIKHLRWSGLDDYLDTPQHIWRSSRDSPDVLGYITQSGPLTMAVVRNAGHMVPHDQPLAARDLITRFIFEQSFH